MNGRTLAKAFVDGLPETSNRKEDNKTARKPRDNARSIATVSRLPSLYSFLQFGGELPPFRPDIRHQRKA